MKQPEALRLADAMQELDGLFSRTGACGEAAAELRRLHEVNADLLEALNGMLDNCYDTERNDVTIAAVAAARAAIAKATGEQP